MRKVINAASSISVHWLLSLSLNWQQRTHASDSAFQTSLSHSGVSRLPRVQERERERENSVAKYVLGGVIGHLIRWAAFAWIQCAMDTHFFRFGSSRIPPRTSPVERVCSSERTPPRVAECRETLCARWDGLVVDLLALPLLRPTTSTWPLRPFTLPRMDLRAHVWPPLFSSGNYPPPRAVGNTLSHARSESPLRQSLSLFLFLSLSLFLPLLCSPDRCLLSRSSVVSVRVCSPLTEVLALPPPPACILSHLPFNRPTQFTLSPSVRLTVRAHRSQHLLNIPRIFTTLTSVFVLLKKVTSTIVFILYCHLFRSSRSL